MGFLHYINALCVRYAPILEAIETLFGVVIGIGLFCLAYRANGIAKSNLKIAAQEKASRLYRMDKDEREIFRSCYEKLVMALALVGTHGRVTNEAFNLFSQALGQARLELPQPIHNYMQEIGKELKEADCLQIELKTPEEGGLLTGEKREQVSTKHMELIRSLLKKKPDEVFRPYMKVPALSS
jgi:hypothetical protein